MKKIGIDCGASTIKLVCTEDEKVIYTDTREHFGSPFRALGAMVREFSDTHPECADAPTALCGSCVPDIVNKDCIISDIPAITEGAKLLCPEAMSAIDIGSRSAGYDGKLDPKKKTVGVPLVLVIHKLFPMINAYFKALGLRTRPHRIKIYAKACGYAK